MTYNLVDTPELLLSKPDILAELTDGQPYTLYFDGMHFNSREVVCFLEDHELHGSRISSAELLKRVEDSMLSRLREDCAADRINDELRW